VGRERGDLVVGANVVETFERDTALCALSNGRHVLFEVFEGVDRAWPERQRGVSYI
jgi:hypothetical protein